MNVYVVGSFKKMAIQNTRSAFYISVHPFFSSPCCNMERRGYDNLAPSLNPSLVKFTYSMVTVI